LETENAQRICHGNEDDENYVKFRLRIKVDSHLANVDLELESSDSIQPLISELGDNILPFYPGGEVGNGKSSGLEIGDYPLGEKWIYQSYDDKENLVGGADVLISAFCDLIENLRAESRHIWDKCYRKEFDIGFESGDALKSFHTQIRAETLKRVSDLGASILITVYPHLNYEYRKKD
jgi:hypothetical protein